MKSLLFAILIVFFSSDLYCEEFDIEPIEFISHSDRLSGSIVFPKEGKVHAAVVFVHGSGRQERNTHWAKRFASEGIAALVYDKRGVGRSGGEYESQQSVSEKTFGFLPTMRLRLWMVYLSTLEQKVYHSD